MAQTDSSKPVPVASEPSHHQVLANDFVQVFHVKVAPHSSTLMHVHARDYVGVHLTSVDLTNTPAGGPPKQVHTEVGAAQLIKAPLTHMVTNNSDTPYENITVALLKSSPQHPAGAVPATDLNGTGVTARLLFENDIVRAWSVEMAPGATQPHHVHQLPYLAIAITDINFKSVPDKGAPEMISPKAGDVAWRNPPLAHTLTNMSDQPAKYVALEFK